MKFSVAQIVGPIFAFVACVGYCAENAASSRVPALDGTVAFHLPAGWAVVESGGKTLLGPTGAAFVEIAYIEASPGNDATEVDDGFLRLFVEKNLKVDTSEKLAGGRFIAHTVSHQQADGVVHQWNVARRLDARHLAVVIAGAEASADQEKLMPVVERILRSVEFMPPK
jgi:hypothetical protein